MKRLKLVLILLVAAIVAAEPVVHTHPLVPSPDANGIGTPNICAACATAQQVAVSVPPVVAPAVIIERLVAAAVVIVSFEAPRLLSSRAPPVA